PVRVVRRNCFATRIAAATLAVFAGAARGEDADSPFGIAESLAQGRFTLELRPRFNRIEESNYPERTQVGTVRAIAGWRSAPFHDWRLTLEGIHTDHFGSGSYNDNGALLATSPFPLLPDPRYTGVNQAHVEYSGVEGLRLRMGRQVVRMDNQRWVSDNDFRQIPQLFDGVSAAYTGIAATELSAGQYWRVRSTSGVVSPLKLSILRAAWNPLPGHALSTYGYFHDQAANGAFTGFADNSYRAIGVKAEGSAASFANVEIPYIAEYAQQRRYADGDSRIDANYRRAGAGLATTDWTLRYDYEVKGSNAGVYGLQMPLTDFYAFNGWTLHFYNTPRQGLRDQWLTGRAVAANATLYAEAHRFRSDFGGIGLGRELDLSIAYPLMENGVLRLQHARYDPGAGTPDPRIRKTWLTFALTY
ncbi:MAG TPA: alginate export family protein, partial [Usitatibacter sp.]